MKRLAFCLMLLVAATGFGTPLKQETLELPLIGNLDFDSADGDVEFMVMPGLGYFILDDIEVGGLVGLGYNGQDRGYMLGAFGEINFDLESPVVPFLGIRPSFNFGDYYPENHFYLEGLAGLKFFLSEWVAISTELFYGLANKDVFADIDSGGRNSDAGMRLGVRCFF